MEDRAIILLKATLGIFKNAQESFYVEDVMGCTAVWDGVEADGYCLEQEIKDYLDEEGVNY